MRSRAEGVPAWRPRNTSREEILENIPRDDHSLYLTRTLADLADLGIAHHALDGVISRVAISAVNLNGFDGGPHGQLRAIQLRHGGLYGERLPLLCEPGCVVREVLPCLDLHCHVGQL